MEGWYRIPVTSHRPCGPSRFVYLFLRHKQSGLGPPPVHAHFRSWARGPRSIASFAISVCAGHILTVSYDFVWKAISRTESAT